MAEYDPAKSPWFEEHLVTQVPEWLYHYTTQAGLLGIVNEHGLHATKIQYMNDSTELTLSIDLARARIDSMIASSLDDNLRCKLSTLFPRPEGIANVNIFVACFCEDGDLLSQWRGYSGNGYGFALGLSGQELLRRASASEFKWGKCIYGRADKVRIVDEIINNSLLIPDDMSRAVAFERGLIRVGAFFKHEKFEKEDEWRLVSAVTRVGDDGVGFRAGQSMLMPYTYIDLGAESDSAIKHVVVGPCPHMTLSKALVNMLLMQNWLMPRPRALYEGPDVRESSIPYRCW